MQYPLFPDNGKPERSIFKAMVEDIGKVLGGNVYMSTYDSGEFGVKPALDAGLQSKLKKESTDYAEAVLNQFSSNSYFYRGFNFSPFAESGLDLFYYNRDNHQIWWLGTQFSPYIAQVHGISSNGHTGWNPVGFVFGVVVCIR